MAQFHINLWDAHTAREKDQEGKGLGYRFIRFFF